MWKQFLCIKYKSPYSEVVKKKIPQTIFSLIHCVPDSNMNSKGSQIKIAQG